MLAGARLAGSRIDLDRRASGVLPVEAGGWRRRIRLPHHLGRRLPGRIVDRHVSLLRLHVAPVWSAGTGALGLGAGLSGGGEENSLESEAKDQTSDHRRSSDHRPSLHRVIKPTVSAFNPEHVHATSSHVTPRTIHVSMPPQ